MELIIKKTTELTDGEKQDLLDCFVEVFKRKRTMVEMQNQYLNTPMGYSVHALCYDEGKLIAAHNAFPVYYWIGDEKIKAYFGGDTMVKKGYRDGFVFLDVVRGLGKYMDKEGYVFSFGFPNDNSYPVFKKVKLAKDIGRLDTYILPYRIGGIKKNLKWLNPLSKLFCRLWVKFSGIGLKKDIYAPLIRKDDHTYNPSRYKRLDGDYCHVKQAVIEFYYKIREHEGVRTAFIIDVVGKSEWSFHQAVQLLIKTECKSFDLLMYVGHLPDSIKKTGLIKIPRKYEPKHFYMTGVLTDKNAVDAGDFYNISNWDVNLSNYDII